MQCMQNQEQNLIHMRVYYQFYIILSAFILSKLFLCEVSTNMFYHVK